MKGEQVEREFNFTFVAVESPKRVSRQTVKNAYLSFAYGEAQSLAQEELGTQVVLKQDHPHYKAKR